MADVFVRCVFDPPADGAGAVGRIARAFGGQAAGDVAWRGAALATDGRRALLWLGAADARRVRAALAPWAAAVEDVWAGTVEAPVSTARATVLVERRAGDARSAAPRLPPALASGDWCLRAHRVTLVRRIVSREGAHAVLLYAAPDAEAVRMAERLAGVRADATWAFAWLAADPSGGSGP